MRVYPCEVTYIMDSVDYGRKLAQTFHLYEDDCIKAMRQEADDIRAEPPPGQRKPTSQQALEMAYEHLVDWLQNGKEYAVKLNYIDVAQFVLSHRKSCVWAVLVAKSRQRYKETGAQGEYRGLQTPDSKTTQ